MDIGAIFLLFAVCIFVAVFVARPFIERRRTTVVSAAEQELSSLMAERDRLITALQELDFDQKLGKIPAEDYPAMRSSLMQSASDVLRRLDAFQPQAASTDAESRVEAVVAARRADAANQESGNHELSDDELEELLASRRAVRKEKTAGFCPTCGKPIMRTDRFCPHCGKSINQ